MKGKDKTVFLDEPANRHLHWAPAVGRSGVAWVANHFVASPAPRPSSVRRVRKRWDRNVGLLLRKNVALVHPVGGPIGCLPHSVSGAAPHSARRAALRTHLGKSGGSGWVLPRRGLPSRTNAAARTRPCKPPWWLSAARVTTSSSLHLTWTRSTGLRIARPNGRYSRNSRSTCLAESSCPKTRLALLICARRPAQGRWRLVWARVGDPDYPPHGLVNPTGAVVVRDRVNCAVLARVSSPGGRAWSMSTSTSARRVRHFFCCGPGALLQGRWASSGACASRANDARRLPLVEGH